MFSRKTLEELRPAILLLPLHSHAPPPLRTVLLPPRDPQGGRPSEASNYAASDTSTSHEDQGEEGAALWVLGASASESSDSRSLDLSVDSYLVDRDGATFSMQEVFGLHASNHPLTSVAASSRPAASTVPSSSSAAAGTVVSGGHFVREECVVCLTEQRTVVLLPCRHLCVCLQCLLFVDKCPVCRAFFQEYAVIQCPSNSTTNPPADPIPATQTV